MVRELWLTDFRSYDEAHVEFTPGTTVVVGDNGQGKTNLLEAVGWLSLGASLRGASNDALVRSGAERAIVRSVVEERGRPVRLEAEIVAAGRNRIQVNGQRITKVRDLLGHLRTTVFAPDDLVLVKGGPGVRRAYLDDLLVAIHPRNHGLRTDLDRVLRQRNSLLKQAGGRATPEVESTLDVWDTKLADVGERLVAARRELLDRLEPEVAAVYGELAETTDPVVVRYESAWEPTTLHDRLATGRLDDLRRGGHPGRSPPRRRRGSPWPGCPPGATPHRVSNGRWPSRCGSPVTGS